MTSALDPFPLRGLCIGISISAGDDGIPPGEAGDAFVNQLTFQTCSRFLFLGSRIALGHMWRPDGIMEHLAHRAMEFRYSFTASAQSRHTTPILNLIAWPDKLPDWEKDFRLDDQIQSLLDVRQLPPPNIDTAGLTLDTPLGKFARMRALTAVRNELVAASDFRICLGGAAGQPTRRLPGVLEEALLTYAADKPLYLASAFGGITKILCNVILRRSKATSDRGAFFTPSEAAAHYTHFQEEHPFPESEGPSLPNAPYDAFSQAESITISQLSSRAGLSEDDYLTLMTTPDVSRALQLINLGIASSSHARKGAAAGGDEASYDRSPVTSSPARGNRLH